MAFLLVISKEKYMYMVSSRIKIAREFHQRLTLIENPGLQALGLINITFVWGFRRAYNQTEKCFKTSYIAVLIQILFEFDCFLKRCKKSNQFNTR